MLYLEFNNYLVIIKKSRLVNKQGDWRCSQAQPAFSRSQVVGGAATICSELKP